MNKLNQNTVDSRADRDIIEYYSLNEEYLPQLRNTIEYQKLVWKYQVMDLADYLKSVFPFSLFKRRERGGGGH